MVDATAPGQKPTLAEAVQEAEEKSGLSLPLSSKPVCFAFGPENGAVSYRKLIATKTAAPSPAAIRGTLPRGAQSPGQAEPTPVPLAESRGERG
jgi:hypothetical protein